MNRRAPVERANKRIECTLGQVEALEAALAASQARAGAAEAKVSEAQAQIAALTLMVEQLRRALYGRRSERTERLLGQLELEREPYPLPRMVLDRRVESILDFTYDDFELVGYEHHPGIKAPIAV